MKKTNLLALISVAVLSTACAGLKSGTPDPKPAQKAATGVEDDAAVTTRVKSALVANPEMSGFKIDVSTTQGVVKLKGEIKSLALRRKAEELVKSVSGVKSVDNQLIITG